MKSKTLLTITAAAVAAVLLGGAAVSAQDKYSVKVPGGLAFSEFKGYENWQVINLAHTDDLIKAIVGNPQAMDAYRAGIPGNGKPFPDGAKLAKLEWKKQRSADAPYDVKVANEIFVVEFMVRDGKRFADGNGWGYAVFKWDAASNGFKPAGLDHFPPQANDAKCGVACHTIAKAKNHVFTEYVYR